MAVLRCLFRIRSLTSRLSERLQPGSARSVRPKSMLTLACLGLATNQPQPPPHAFKIRGGCEGGGKGYLGQDEQAFTITTGHDQQVAAPINTQIATRHNAMGERTGFGVGENGDPAFTLQAAHCHAVATQYAVRRLTPTECERLQGFPDGYTNIPWRGKPEAPDGPRYKALGNSWAVPCVTWIGNRINEAVK